MVNDGQWLIITGIFVGFLSHGGTPFHHPAMGLSDFPWFSHGNSHRILRAWGSPMTMETTIWVYYGLIPATPIQITCRVYIPGLVNIQKTTERFTMFSGSICNSNHSHCFWPLTWTQASSSPPCSPQWSHLRRKSRSMFAPGPSGNFGEFAKTNSEIRLRCAAKSETSSWLADVSVLKLAYKYMY